MGIRIIKRVEHFGIIVSEMDESINFYEVLLDFKVRVRSNNGEKELTFWDYI
ncbi:VOC family protein [Peribacillus kribbensis]|uniref:VOC family protein n=1 Tax=Peribacillus kribbensis TaxID=356658 RepID=UPI00138AE8FD